MGILDFISEITSAFSITAVDADAPQADETSGSENQDEGEEKDVNSEDDGEEQGSEEQEEEEEEEEEPEDIKQKLEEGKANSFASKWHPPGNVGYIHYLEATVCQVHN